MALLIQIHCMFISSTQDKDCPFKYILIFCQWGATLTISVLYLHYRINRRSFMLVNEVYVNLLFSSRCPSSVFFLLLYCFAWPPTSHALWSFWAQFSLHLPAFFPPQQSLFIVWSDCVSLINIPHNVLISSLFPQYKITTNQSVCGTHYS